MSTPSLLWFRRDLRIDDHRALSLAATGPVVGLFVLDPALLGPAGRPRLRFLASALDDLDDLLEGQLAVVVGDPATVVTAAAAAVGATMVHATDDYGPYGRRRDAAVAAALEAAGRRLVLTDSPYAVAPGSIYTGSGTPFQVFTPFYKAWLSHGWEQPEPAPDASWAPAPADLGLVPRAERRRLITGGDQPIEGAGDPAPELVTGPPGPRGAHDQLDAFLRGPVDSYDSHRDVPAEPGTSRLSAQLRWGTIHPRQVLAALGPGPGADAFARQLAWREFYADVLFHRPDTARCAYQPRMAAIEVDEGPDAHRRFEAWAEGATGFPIVDAGMRQLRTTGWLHNRVRLIVASFLVKDLHLDWTRGARWFMQHLTDGDLANNSHGWQWVAGTGTDAAPYFRIFNPVSQGQRFDPAGRYVRTWIPELAAVPDRWVHCPWDNPKGQPLGYPGPIVDHSEERSEALRRYETLKAGL